MSEPSLIPVTVPVVAPRPDGSRVEAPELAAILRGLKVAAAVRDGAEVGFPGLCLMTVALDEEDGTVAVWDGAVTQGPTIAQVCGIVASGLRTPLILEVKDRSTIALLPDGTEIETSERDRDRDRAAIVLALQARADSRSVKAYASTDPLDAEVTARAVKKELPVVVADGWTAVRLPDNHDGFEEAGGVTAETPVAVRVAQDGRQRTVQVAMHTPRGRVGFTALCAPEPSLVHDDYAADLRALLVDDERLVVHEGSAEPPAEVRRAVEAAPATEAFVRSVLAVFDVPAEVVRWAEGGEPGPDAATVRPRSMAGIVGAGMGRQVDQDTRRQGLLSRYVRFVHGHPVRSVAWGLLELVVGVLLLTLAADADLTPWLRIVLAVLLLVDGSSNVAWGLLRRRAG